MQNLPKPSPRTWLTCALTLIWTITLCLAAHALPGWPVVISPPQPARLTQTLPLEITWAKTPATSEQTLRLWVSGRGTTLWLRLHGLENEQEGSIRVDNGAWIPLTNHTTTADPFDAPFGGIGGNATVGLSLPAHLPLSWHTLTFRFDKSLDFNSEFRVLAVDVRDAAGKSVINKAVLRLLFREHDPATETPPLTDATSIKAGENLWHSAQLVSAPDGSLQKAACADCHSEDGRDLKYYSYSNYSIIQRAKFHGLTQLQAEQIASYIRTLPVASYGRPWNPPYQPGPGIDSKPVVQWAAGAGVGAVLDNDAAMLPYLFPHGITYNPSDKDGIGAQDTLNMREMPVALQLPDWNHWLPRIHPKDAWGDTFTQSAFAQFYDGQGPSRAGGTNLRAILSNPDPGYHAFITSSAGARLPSLLNSWSGGDYGDFISRRQAQNDGSALYQEKMESSAKWMLVKNWELMQEYHLEGNAPAIFPTQANTRVPSNAPTAGESRAWVSEAAFLVSPAFVGVREDGSLYRRAKYEYLTNAWYYTQMVLNAGNRHRDGWHPVDWGYAIGRTGDLYRATGVPMRLLMTAMLIKAIQQSDTNGTLSATTGWFPHFAGDMRFFYWHAGIPEPGLSAAAWAQIATAVAGAQFDKMQEFSPAQWQQSAQGQGQILYGGDSLENMQRETLSDLAVVDVDPGLLAQETMWDRAVWSGF